MFRSVRKLLGDRRAATAIEYGFILALVVLALMVGLRSLALTTTGMWNNIANDVARAR